MIFSRDRNDLEADFRNRFPAFAEKLIRHIRPTAEMKLDPQPGGLSKLGGRPHLPAGMAWPRRRPPLKHDNSVLRLLRQMRPKTPLGFVAQIDLEEITRSVALDIDLPEKGLLLLFYDVEEQPWGFCPSDSEGWRLIHVSGPVEEASWPRDLDANWRFTEVGLTPLAGWSAPPDDFQQPPDCALSHDELMAYGDAYILEEDRQWTPPTVRVGGWPWLIRNDIQLAAQLASSGVDLGTPGGYRRGARFRSGAWMWRLVMEIGSVDEADMMWGDVGSLYVQMRADHLRAQRFDRAWLELQCS
jgi:uncharacterized protein YwqG